MQIKDGSGFETKNSHNNDQSLNQPFFSVPLIQYY